MAYIGNRTYAEMNRVDALTPQSLGQIQVIDPSRLSLPLLSDVKLRGLQTDKSWTKVQLRLTGEIMNEMTSLAMLLTHGYVVMISLSLKLARSVNDPDVEALRTLSCKIMSYKYAINVRDIKELSLYDCSLILCSFYRWILFWFYRHWRPKKNWITYSGTE